MQNHTFVHIKVDRHKHPAYKKPVRQIPLESLEPKRFKKAYGGELLKTRKGRAHGRPLATRQSMHLVLRSTKAKGDWSFKRPKNERRIREIVARFATKFGVKVLNMANVGNHLHLHIQLTNRYAYDGFIRAVTASIAMAITGASRWRPMAKLLADRGSRSPSAHPDRKATQLSFWDYRPYTRIVIGQRGRLALRDYVRINQIEGFGVSRTTAHWLVLGTRKPPVSQFETHWPQAPPRQSKS